MWKINWRIRRDRSEPAERLEQIDGGEPKENGAVEVIEKGGHHLHFFSFFFFFACRVWLLFAKSLWDFFFLKNKATRDIFRPSCEYSRHVASISASFIGWNECGYFQLERHVIRSRPPPSGTMSIPCFPLLVLPSSLPSGNRQKSER